MKEVPIHILTSPLKNKRTQLLLAFRHVTSPVTIIADDDTTWSSTTLSTVLSPFTHDYRLGAAYPEVQIRPCLSSNSKSRVFGEDAKTIWEILASIRLFGDAIDMRASMLLDGGVFCGSGTTAAYRSEIVQDPDFAAYFEERRGLGEEEKRVSAGDDQALNKWVSTRGWRVVVVPDVEYGNLDSVGGKGCRVETTMRTDSRHLGQLLRWSRSDWVTCWRCIQSLKMWRQVCDRSFVYLSGAYCLVVVGRTHPFTNFTRLTWMLGSFTWILELLYFLSLVRPSSNLPLSSSTSVFLLFLNITLSRLSRYLPYILAKPSRLQYLGPFLGYLYAQQAVKMWAGGTVGNVSIPSLFQEDWGEGGKE